MLIISCKKYILSTCFILSWVKEALWFRSRTSLAISLRESLYQNLFVKITSQTRYLWTWHLTVVLHCGLPTEACDAYLWRSRKNTHPKACRPLPELTHLLRAAMGPSVSFALCSNNSSLCNSWAGFRLLSTRRLPTA